MTTCNVCRQEKSDSEFYPHKTRKNGLSAECRECRKRLSKEVYRRNPQPYKDRAKLTRKDLKQRRKNWINELRLKYGCVLCQEKDLEVLDFHHFDSKDKLFNITNSLDCAINDLVNEINKCVILCANCHRRVHAGTRELTPDMKCDEIVPARRDKSATVN